jgi:hypothetical protein
VKGYSIKVDIKPRGSYTSLIKNFTDSTTWNSYKTGLTEDFVCNGIDRKEIYLQKCFCTFKSVHVVGAAPEFRCYYFKKHGK